MYVCVCVCVCVCVSIVHYLLNFIQVKDRIGEQTGETEGMSLRILNYLVEVVINFFLFDK